MISKTSLLTLILAFLELVRSGIIYPDTARPIEPFTNNVPTPPAQVITSYTFNFRVQTPSVGYPILKITFPAIYNNLVAGDTYPCTFTQSPTVISENCIVGSDGFTLIFPEGTTSTTEFYQITGASATLKIDNLKNPEVSGGTGSGFFSFQMESREGLLIDSNDFFGTIALASAYTYFPSVSISNDGASIAGFVTNYVVTFQNAKEIPAGSKFRFYLPSGYGFSNTKCALQAPAVTLTCYNVSTTLIMEGLTQDLPPGTYRLKVRNIQNPFIKNTFSGFEFESLVQGTNTVIEKSSSINSISITAGSINNPSIQGIPLNKNLRIDYTISFTPSNTIPEGGSIEVIFPPTFGALDSTCRIIRGLVASTSGLTCTGNSATRTVTISGFTETNPQYIELKIYATNPNVVGPTDQFQIASYRTFPGTPSTLIDENLNAGTVTISDVDNPYFVEVDMYRPYTNISLNNVGPLDFRLYPKTALPASTGSVRPQVWLQIPLWWWPVSSFNSHRCSFGPLDSGDTNGCIEQGLKFKMTTPTSKGLELCDLPISIESVRVSKIPGRYPFRVHTFLDYNAAPNIPDEQDLYYMDIPAEEFSTYSGSSVSLDSVDNDAIISVSFVVGVSLPYEGAINLNFSTQANVYENTASWDPELGFDFTNAVNGMIKISCRVTIGGAVVGYSGAANHKKVNCVAIKGNSTSNAIIQVRGFNSQVNSGTTITVDIPNIKMCNEVTMNCVFELTTSYTTTLIDPYTLNYATINLGTIQTGPTLITGNIAPKPTLAASYEICLPVTWTFSFTASQALAPGSSILLKMPAAKFTFNRAGITSSIGSVKVIYVAETDEIYYLITTTTTVGPAVTFTLNGLRNSNGELNTAPEIPDFSGVVVKAIYWTSTRSKIEKLEFAQTDPWTDGGISGLNMESYPNTNPPFIRNLNLRDWIPFTITFTTCHSMKPDAGIRIQVPVSDYDAVSENCSVWQGLTGQTTNNGFTTSLICYFDGVDSYKIQGFNAVGQFATITIGFSVKSKATPLTTPGNYYVRTYYDTSYDPSRINDYSPAYAGIAIPGLKTFPLYLDFIDWLAKPQVARIGTLGTFTLNVTLTNALPAWTAGQDPHILFILDPSMDLNPQSGLECRIDGAIAYYCRPEGNFAIRMATNQYTGIPANTPVTVVLTTLGAFYSDNYRDGINFNEAGRFTLTGEAYRNGALIESSQLSFEVYGRDFLRYWVYSLNKGRGGRTLIKVMATFNDGDSIPASNNVSPMPRGKIVLEFRRTPTSGFASDLGTGIPNKGKIPCISFGLNILPTETDVTCTLNHGLFNNPTKIEVSGFDYTDTETSTGFEIHIPNIFNPDHAADFDIPNVVTRIYTVDTATSVETEIFYHEYDLINVTYPQNPATTPVTITVAPSLNQNTLNTPARLTIQLKPSAPGLFGSDSVVLELPLFWKPAKVLTCNFGGNTRCTGYPDSKWILIEWDVQTTTTPHIPPTGLTGYIDLDTPPALIPTTSYIIAYYYHEFKLWNTVTYPPLSTILVPFPIPGATVTTADTTLDVDSIYTISFTPPEDIPEGGAIRVIVPPQLPISATFCTNDAIGGSLLSDVGFKCDVDLATNSFIAYGFPTFPQNNLVVLQILLHNPATAVTIPNFVIETHYLYSTNPNTQICQQSVPAPPLVPPAVTPVLYWDVQYSHRRYLYAGDTGPLDFIINAPNDFSPTDVLIVEFPTAWNIAPEAQPDCFWDGVPAETVTWTSTTNPKVLRISSPAGTTITANTDHTLKITSLNGMNGVNGFTLPTTPGTYTLTFKTSSDGGATFREVKSVNLEVYAVSFTSFISTTEIVNYNMTTSIKIDFQPQTTIPGTTGKLILYIPTKDEKGVILWDNDLRSGVPSGGTIPCHDVGNTMQVEPTCTIIHGDRTSGLPVKVQVTGFTINLVPTTTYSFRITGIKTPVETGDNKHVVMRLESYNGGTVLNAGLHYDFTIQKIDPTIVDWSSNAAKRPSTSPLNAGQTGVTFTLDLYTSAGHTAAARFDYFIVEFPASIQQPLGLKCNLASDTQCVSLPGNNWLFYDKSDADVAAGGTYPSLLILNANQAPGQLLGATFVSYAVKNRVAVTKVIYPPMDYSALVVQSITATVTVVGYTAGSIPHSAPLKYAIQFTIPSGAVNIIVPAGGAIEFELPASLTPVDEYCENDTPTSAMTGDYRCTMSSNIYTIIGFNQLNPGTVVRLTFWAIAASAGTPTFKLRLFQDEAKTIKMAENPSITSPAISAYTGFSKIYPIDTESLDIFGVRAGDVAPYKFKVSLEAPLPSYIDVAFPAGVQVPTSSTLVCGWSNYEAEACTVTQASPLKVRVYVPISPPLTAGTIYDVFISAYISTGMNGRQGLSFTTAGKGNVVVTIGAVSRSIPIEVYNTDFTSLIISPFWSNANEINHYGIQLQPSSPIPSGGKIIVTFPYYTLDGTVSLFTPDLGTGLESGSTLFCSSQTKTTLVPVTDEIVCKIYYGSKPYTYIEITNFNAVASGNTIEFFIRGIKNPSTGDKAHVHLEVHTEDQNGNVLNKRLVPDIFTAQTLTSSSLSATYTRSSDVLQATGVTYTFPAMTLASGKSITTRSKIIIEFQDVFTIPSTVNPTVTAGGTPQTVTKKVYANYIVITPTGAFPSGTVAITVTGITNPYSQDDTTAGINIYFVYYMGYMTKYKMTASSAFTLGSLPAPTLASSGNDARVETDFTFKLQPDKKIPTGGSIQITFPNFIEISRGVAQTALKTPVTFSVGTSGSNKIATFVLGREYVPGDGEIQLVVTGIPPAGATTHIFTTKVLFDSVSTNKVIASAITSWTTTTNLAQGSLVIVSSSVRTSQATTITALYTPGAATPANINKLSINIGSFTSPSTCSVNGVTVTCSASGSVLTMTGLTGLNPTVNIIKFNAQTPAGAGWHRISVTTIQNSGSDTLLCKASDAVSIGGTAFTSFTATVAHKTTGQPNILTVNAQTGGSAITSPLLFIELPGFPSTLGGYADGDEIPCYSNFVSTVSCILIAGSANNAPRLKVLNIPTSLPANTNFMIKVFRIASPTTAGDAGVYVRVSEITTGNLETDRYVGSASFVFTSSAPIVISKTLPALGSYIVQVTNTYTLSIASISCTNGDLIFYHMPYADYSVAGTPTCPGCTLYKSGGVIERPITATVTSDSITVTGLENTPVVPLSSDIVGYVVQSGTLAQIVTFTPASPFAASTLTSPSMTPLEANNDANPHEYLVSFTMNEDIPKGGIIRIQFASTDFAGTPKATELKLTSGTYTGDPVLKVSTQGSNVFVDLTGFTSFSSSAVQFSLKLTNGKASGTVNPTIKTCGDSSCTYLIASGAVSYIYDGTSAKTYAYSTTRFVLGQTKAYKSGQGIWSFGFKQTSLNLSETTHKLRVIPRSTFTFSTNLLRCKLTSRVTGVSYIASDCYLNSVNEIEIIPPVSNSLTVDEWQVEIYTTESNNRGLPFPTSNIEHIFQVNLETSAGTTVETNIIRYRVFDLQANGGNCQTYLNNINEQNLVKLNLLLTSTLASTSKLMIELPTISPTTTFGNTDLYDGFIHQDVITCKVKANGAVDNMAKCIFRPGADYEIKSSTIFVQNFGGSYGSGTQIEVSLSLTNGPVEGIWTSARLITVDSSNNYLNLYNVKHFVYTVTTTPTVESRNFPTSFSNLVVQNSVNIGIQVNPTPAIDMDQTGYRMRFKYNEGFYGGATQAIAGHTMEFWSNAITFISFNSDPAITPQTFTMNNMRNPISDLAFTSEFQIDIIHNRAIVHTLQYNTGTTPAFTYGTFAPVTVTPASTVRSDEGQYSITFQSNKNVPEGGAFVFTFPAGYSVETFCSSNIMATCTVSGNQVQLINTPYVAAGTSINIIVNARNPSTAGSTGNFALESYELSTLMGKIAQNTAITGLTLGTSQSFSKLIPLPRKSEATKMQATQSGPLTFTINLGGALAAGGTDFVNFVFPGDLFLPTATPVVYTDLICFWDENAAPCTKITNGYRVFTPYETPLSAGTNYTITITTNRQPVVGFTYPATDIYDVPATESNGATQTRKLIVPMTPFVQTWVGSRITTKDEFTIIYFRIQASNPINGQLVANKGQLIIEFPTKAAVSVFPIDLGKGISNGDPVDCWTSVGVFDCKIALGSNTVLGPASIIMEPRTTIPAYTTIDVRLPMIKLAQNEKIRSQIRIYTRQFDSALIKWNIMEEKLIADAFYTTLSTITTTTGLPAPVFTPNTVGNPTTVNFNFNLPQQLDINSYDRIIIYTETPGATVPSVPPNSPQGTCYTYTISKWVELQPGITLNANPSFAASFTNWINQPYVIAGGVGYHVYVWKDGNVIRKYSYLNTVPPIPHALVPPNFLDIWNIKIRAVTNLEFIFKPYNSIPEGGTIEITVPTTWQTIGPQCDITAGLVGAYCVIQDDGDPTTPDTKKVIIQGFSAYDAAADGNIRLVLGSVNPLVGGPTAQFTLTTFWPTGEIIDQDLNYGNLNIDASATFVDFKLISLQQKQTTTCSGNTGPLKIRFQLRNSLTYPNGFIVITLDPNFQRPPVMQELLCYFKYSDIYNLKSHRCQWVGNDITVYAPEEKNFVAGEIIDLTITTRGAAVKYMDGVRVPGTPGNYYIRVATSNNLEEAYPIAQIQACPFAQGSFYAESAVWEANGYTLFFFNFTTTTAMPSSANGGRIVVEVPTHNEIAPTFEEDLGYDWITEDSGLFGCGTTGLQSSSGGTMECTFMKAAGQSWGDKVIIFTSDVQAIANNQNVNFQLARIHNPPTAGWPYFTHVRIRTQKMLADGSYIDLNDHWAWFIVPQYLPASTVSQTSAGAFGWWSGGRRVATTDRIVDGKNGAILASLRSNDHIIFEYTKPVDLVLPGRITCYQHYNYSYMPQARCASHRDAWWMNLIMYTDEVPPWTLWIDYFTFPHYQTSIGVIEYQVKDHMVVAKILRADFTSVPGYINVVMQTPSSTNDVGETLKYQVGVDTQTDINKVKYFKLKMPNNFINPHDCVIRRGLVLQDVNDPNTPIVCQITPVTGGYQFEFFNFTYNGDGWFIFEITITNPPTPVYTGTWEATSYDNYDGALTDLTRVIDRTLNSYGRTWVGAKPYPNLFRVYRNTISFENRRAQEDDWAEMDIRIMTKKDVPPDSGKVEVWLPSEYDIPNGGEVVCELGNDYHTDLNGQFCSISSDRKVYMNTDPVHGIKANTCSLLHTTTKNSAGGNNGFQVPSTPGSYDFQVFIYNGSNLQEYSNPSPKTLPDPLSSIYFRLITRESNIQTVVRFGFTTPVAIPAGYDTDASELDPFKKKPIGTIAFDFNTRDSFAGYTGWALNLGLPNTDVPCKVIQGLVPRAGKSSITCTLIPSTQYNPKNPARIILSDFEYIVDNTYVEIHFMNIRNPNNVNNNGNAAIGAYQTFGDGSTAWIIASTTGYQAPWTANALTPQIRTDLVLTPNYVGSVLLANFPFAAGTNLYAKDVFILKLPSPNFEIPDDGSISAVIDGVQLITWVYNDTRVNEIHFEFPTGTSMVVPDPPDKVLKVSGLRHMAYYDGLTYSITLTLVRSSSRVQIIRYDGIESPPPGAPYSLVMTPSSYFSGDVYVTYDFTIVPSYHIPENGVFWITMPSPLYDNLFNSNPPVTCNLLSDLIKNCAFVGTNQIRFEANTKILESTPISLQLIGVKNPSVVGTYAGPTLSIYTAAPASKIINTGSFDSITFIPAKSPDKIFMNIKLTSYYKSVVTDHAFVLQSSNNLPIGGQIILEFPSDWVIILPVGFNTISSLEGSWTTSKLIYTTSYNPATRRLTITTNFVWPAKTSVYVKINGLTNPSTITTTGVFVASTTYDSVTLDQTDPTDLSNTISYLDYAPSISVTSSNFYPQNEGESATYNLEFSSGEDIPAGAQIELAFPPEYGSLLATVDKEIACYSPELPDLECKVQDGKIIIPIEHTINASTPFSISIQGISNPNAGATGGMSITTVLGDQTLQFTSNAVAFTTAPAAPNMDLIKLTTTSTNLQAKATYEICSQTPGAVPPGAQIFIEFPEQFTIRQDDFTCSVGPGNNALNYPNGVNCTVIKNLRRFILTGQDNSLTAGTMRQFCYKIEDVENPADSGESGSFVMSIYDPSTQKILYKTYGILSYPTTIVYERVGLRIIVDEIADFSVGLMSAMIGVTLERKVPYDILLTPSSPGFTFCTTSLCEKDSTTPTIIKFSADSGATQYFRILPNDGTPAGSYYIQWAKYEDTANPRFAEVPNSFFNYIEEIVFNQYKVLLGTTVSRTALKGTSLPITIRLTQAPAEDMYVYYETIKPNQPEYLTFDPEVIVFHPGETEKQFSYTTKVGAVSGLIQFTLQDKFKSMYFMEVDQINFEILDIDYEPPDLLNDYIVELDRTYMYYRISTSESAWAYYLLTLKGTVEPPIDELKDPSLRVARGTKTDVTEITGKNCSVQTAITQTYIYHDTYLMFTGLEEQTDYILYYYVEDLSGNSIKMRSIEFTTRRKHQPARFTLMLQDDTDTDQIIAAFSLITGIPTSRWIVNSAPPKFKIPGNTDPVVQDIIDQDSVAYEFTLLQKPTSDESRPIETVSLLETNKYILIDEVPTVVEDFNINTYSYEILEFDPEFSYYPALVDVKEDVSTFNVSLKRNGTIYGIVMRKGSQRPYPRQIKYCLNSTNFLLPPEYCVKIEIDYPERLPPGQIIYKIVQFTNLFDNTEYEAFFVGDNDLPVNPDLMRDNEIAVVPFLTQRELFIIPEDYNSAWNLHIPKAIGFIVLCLLLII